jgi:hypothetical protein
MTSTVTEVQLQPAGAVAAVQMARRDVSGAVLCCAASPPAGATTLRCRFPGGADVPAQRCAKSGGVSCVPPASATAAGGGAVQPYEVFANEELLAEGVYDAAAEPPKAKRHGLGPFVIMCASPADE